MAEMAAPTSNKKKLKNRAKSCAVFDEPMPGSVAAADADESPAGYIQSHTILLYVFFSPFSFLFSLLLIVTLRLRVRSTSTFRATLAR